jgi:hypothetical protein
MNILMKTALICIIASLIGSTAPIYAQDEGDADTGERAAWLVKYEKTLNRRFADEDKGIVAFSLNSDAIYVTVNHELCSCSFLSVTMQWAKRFYTQRRRYEQGPVTAYLVRDGEIMREIRYDDELGYH